MLIADRWIGSLTGPACLGIYQNPKGAGSFDDHGGELGLDSAGCGFEWAAIKEDLNALQVTIIEDSGKQMAARSLSPLLTQIPLPNQTSPEATL